MEEANQKPARILQPAPKRKSHKKLIIGITLIVLVFGLLLGLYLMKPKNPFPENIRKEISYPLYYPEKLPEGYKLDKSSVKVESNIMFFTLDNEDKKIIVSEQAIPSQPPDLANIQGFKKFNTSSGDAVIGSNVGRPTAILLSNTTLITISGDNKIPQDVIVQTTENMVSLPD